ncbi:hypothetical protein TNCV_3573231 [Trichonephila clavipes]|nr:hypothetical protein TNCV_3573231 [Trichonephila clavipes]
MGKSENRSSLGRSDATIRTCWQEWVDSGRFQRHEGSNRPKIMMPSRSFVNSTPLAHADTQRDVLPRGGTSQDQLYQRLIHRYQPPDVLNRLQRKN